MRIEHLRQRLRALGAKPCHEARLLRAWTHALPLDSGPVPAADHLPAAVRAELQALAVTLAGLARTCSEHAGADGSTRLLLELADGQTVESVLLPREGVCVSTQVGCAVGCTFCMTGRAGLLRQLTSGEIVAQVTMARARRAVKKVQFMGMGEPAHNMDNVLEAIELLGTVGGIGHKNLVFSTVGDRRVFERLPQGAVKPALALSLHSARADLRAQLLPKAPPIDPAELVALAEDYARATGYPVQYQWTLLAGINDDDEELDGIVRLLAGKYAVMNFIPWNAVDDLPYRRSDPERVMAMSRRLHRHGILAKLRQSAAQDVDGGCGQLRARPRLKVGPGGTADFAPRGGNARKETVAAVPAPMHRPFQPPEDAMSENVVVTVDLSGLPCPAPLLGAKKILDDLQPGQAMCLVSDCSATHDDLAAWCRYTGNLIVSATQRADGKTAYLLRKADGERTTPVPHVTLDMRGVACPGPIVEARKLLEGMQSGEVLQLLTDCTAAVDDVPLWSRATAVELLLALEVASGAHEFYLRKK